MKWTTSANLLIYRTTGDKFQLAMGCHLDKAQFSFYVLGLNCFVSGWSVSYVAILSDVRKVSMLRALILIVGFAL
jgi:hypothetical protein